MKKIVAMAIFLGCSLVGFAQRTRTLQGVVQDRDNGESLYAANVCLVSDKAGATPLCMACDMDGKFTFKAVPDGKYTLQISYVGYKSRDISVDLTKEKLPDLTPISLAVDAVALSAVEVEGRATRAEQKGDSLVYNAEAFKVIEGSSADELLAKMPGIVVEGGTVEAQGESVKTVLVDGKEFFEGDVNLALKNLPSDLISTIEVFDKQSDQAAFTGFDDGNSTKAINIVTKRGMASGSFGKFTAGGGLDMDETFRYGAGASYSYFAGDTRITLLGSANNVNNQGFSQEDLAGVMSQGGGRRGGPRGGGGGSSMLGSTSGISSSESIGLNYTDVIGEKLKLNGSYFFNHSLNNKEVDSDLEYFEASLLGKTYDEHSESEMNNANHRFNMNMEYEFNEKSKLYIRPSFSFQDNRNDSYLRGVTSNDDIPQLGSETTTNTDTEAYNAGINATYRQAFDREGRSISISGGANVSHSNGDTYYDFLNTLYNGGTAATPEEEQQNKLSTTHKVSYNGNVAYTEKLIDNMLLMANYRLSYSDDNSDRLNYTKNPASDLYDQLNPSLSSDLTSNYLTQAGGLSLLYNTENLRMMAGVNLQYATLNSDQIYPKEVGTNHDFLSVLPSVMMDYTINKTNALRFFYRSYSSAPSANQLQDVIDNSNPLMVSMGNPNLGQQVSHMTQLRHTTTLKSGQTFIAMLGATLRSGYIADSSYVATRDELIAPDVTLYKGAQLTKPVNLNGYYSLQGMVTYGFPVDFLKSNINVSLSANYANVPNVFDGVVNDVSEFRFVPKVVMGSNISRKLDFTLTYAAGLNIAESTLAKSNNDSYMSHSASAKLGWIFGNNFTFGSTLTYTGYTGLEQASEMDYYLLNAYLGKKFLKNNAGELRLELYDILQQNQSFNRTIGSNYYEYTTSNVLRPYAMLTFVYTLRPGMSAPSSSSSRPEHRGGMGMGMGRPPM